MDLLTIFGSADSLAIIKGMFLVGMALYIVFAFIIVKQISHMTKTLQVGFESPVRALGWIHFFASIILFIFASLYL